MSSGNMKILNATDFKAKCLAILDEVYKTGEPVTILKSGHPVAQVVPPVPRDEDHPQISLHGSVTIVADIIAPAVSADQWDAERGDL